MGVELGSVRMRCLPPCERGTGSQTLTMQADKGAVGILRGQSSELQGQGGVMVLTLPVVDNASGLGAEIWEEEQGEPGS